MKQEKQSYVVRCAQECEEIRLQKHSPFNNIVLNQKHKTEDNPAIKELKAEHGVLFVECMISKGKSLLFPALDKPIQTIFKHKHFIALEYALTSLGITNYSTEHHINSDDKKLIFTFDEISMSELLTAKQDWLGAAKQKTM